MKKTKITRIMMSLVVLSAIVVAGAILQPPHWHIMQVQNFNW